MLSWYKALFAETTNTWSELSAVFLTQFNPENKSYGERCMITNLKKTTR
jgi:hypothetical protein